MQPSVFIGHGNPLFVLEPNKWTDSWREYFNSIERPQAILAISAHWYVSYSAVTISASPKTIHDFGGFPDELYKVHYDAPGNPELAQQVMSLLEPIDVIEDSSWGLDHGTWSVLYHAFPDAKIPVVQLSIDAYQLPSFHLEVGKLLAPLRSQGVLILGSGNIVHNLRKAKLGIKNSPAYEFAENFDNKVDHWLRDGNVSKLLDYLDDDDGRLSAPTPDHYLPLLYAYGAKKESDKLTTITTGIDASSISMRSIAFHN